jgi:hypothetical protein
MMGMNVASVVRGGRFGLREFLRGCGRSFEAASFVESAAIPGIPDVKLNDLLGEINPAVHIDTSQHDDGSLPLEHAMALLSLVVAEQPQAVLEIGTFMGRTTKWIAWNLQNGMIHTVDLPEDFEPEAEKDIILPKDDFHLIAKRQVGREYRNDPVRSRVVQHFADTASWNFAEAAASSFFFIDGSHTYEYCRNDSEKCLALCENRPATFLWHDCDRAHPGVIRCLLEWKAQGREIVRIAGTTIAYWKKAF